MMHPLLTVTLACIATLALIVRRRDLRGCTLLAPWCWAVGVVGLAALVELALVARSLGSWEEPLRYVAATATLMPGVALLGAKRPQDVAWQWIVASLWIVLLLPAVQMIITTGGGALDLHLAWRAFLAILIAVEFLNSCLGRYVLSAGLLAVGQVWLLLPQLIEKRDAFAASWLPWTLMTLAVAAWSRSFPPTSGAKDGMNRLWQWFRDGFGLLWSLRVMERFNAAAERYDWPVRMRWSGLVAVDGQTPEPEISTDQRATMAVTLSALLRRFLAPEQIARELTDGVTSDAEGTLGTDERAPSGQSGW